MLPRRYLVFYKHALTWAVICILFGIYFASVYILLLVPLALVDLWLSICLGLMFRVPVKRSNKPLPEGWESETSSLINIPFVGY